MKILVACLFVSFFSLHLVVVSIRHDGGMREFLREPDPSRLGEINFASGDDEENHNLYPWPKNMYVCSNMEGWFSNTSTSWGWITREVRPVCEKYGFKNYCFSITPNFTAEDYQNAMVFSARLNLEAISNYTWGNEFVPCGAFYFSEGDIDWCTDAGNLVVPYGMYTQYYALQTKDGKALDVFLPGGFSPFITKDKHEPLPYIWQALWGLPPGAGLS